MLRYKNYLAKEENLMGEYFFPYFLAISLPFSSAMANSGLHLSLASSYVMRPNLRAVVITLALSMASLAVISRVYKTHKIKSI